MVYAPKFQIKKSSNSQYFWVLIASNYEPILKSEMYESKQGCQNGIASSKLSVADSNFKRLRATNYQYYFNQVANNNWKVLGTSEMYDSSQACENGIAAVKKDAPVASIEDLTI